MASLAQGCAPVFVRRGSVIGQDHGKAFAFHLVSEAGQIFISPILTVAVLLTLADDLNSERREGRLALSLVVEVLGVHF